MAGDPYADLGKASTEMQQSLVDAMIARAEDPKQIEMRQAYLARVDLPDGAIARAIARKPGGAT